MIRVACVDDLPVILSLLRDTRLPPEGVEAHVAHFSVVEREDAILGAVGLEVYGGVGLLRSLVVVPACRHSGLGTQLCDAVVAHAIGSGVIDLYLLTETAAVFFAKRGFVPYPRDQAPAPIRDTQEFRELCPASSTLMKRRLL